MGHPPADALLELHYGEATAGERATILPHVEGCRECATFLADLGRLDRDLSPGPEDTPPAEGLERVLARVASVGPARRPRADWVVALAPSAAVMLAGAWAIHAGGERLNALGMVPGALWGLVPGELLGPSLAALGLLGLGALATLALAPVLILESNGRS
jgi:hypothetical protein